MKRSSKIIPKNIFHGDERCPLYLCLREVVSGRNRLSGLYIPTFQQITRQDRRSKVKVTGLLGDLGTYYGNPNLVHFRYPRSSDATFDGNIGIISSLLGDLGTYYGNPNLVSLSVSKII